MSLTEGRLATRDFRTGTHTCLPGDVVEFLVISAQPDCHAAVSRRCIPGTDFVAARKHFSGFQAAQSCNGHCFGRQLEAAGEVVPGRLRELAWRDLVFIGRRRPLAPVANLTHSSRDPYVEAPAVGLHQYLETGCDHLCVGHAGLRATQAGVGKVPRDAADYPCGGGRHAESAGYGLAGNGLGGAVCRVRRKAWRPCHKRQYSEDDGCQ